MKINKKIRILIFIVFCFLNLNFFWFFKKKPETVKITFFYTNDIHGQIKPVKASWINKKNPPLVGGVSVMKKYIKQYKKIHKDRFIIMTDSGDIYQGTPEGDLTNGMLVLKTLNKFDYTAATLGNHDFDRGETNLITFMKNADFPIVVSNLDCNSYDIKKSYIYHLRNYLKIGFFGILTTDTIKIIGKENLHKFTITNETDAAKKIVEKLKKQKVDLIIGLTHNGAKKDEKIFNKVEGVDIVFGGHDHIGRDKPEEIIPLINIDNKKTIVCSTWGKLSTLGQLEIVYDLKKKKIISYNNKLVSLSVDKIGEDKRMKKYVKYLSKDIDKIMDKKVVESKVTVDRTLLGPKYYSSSLIGNLLTDILRKETGADISFYNNSGIRGVLNKGTILFRNVYQVEPFGNTIMTMKLKGQDIIDFLTSIVEGDDYHQVQVSGLKIYYYKISEKKYKVRKILVNNKPIKSDKFYKIAVPNYIGSGYDGYEVFKKGKEIRDTLKLIRDSLKKFISTKKIFEYKTENKIIKEN